MTETPAQQESETKCKADIYQELLEVARRRWPDRREREKQTGLSRTTEWRIEVGRFGFHTKTIAKLVKALNAK
jgi:hypothetical protein